MRVPVPVPVPVPVLATAILLTACVGRPVAPTGAADRCRVAAESAAPRAAAERACTAAVTDPRLAAPARLGSLVNRGIVRVRRGQLAAAIADFDAAIRAAPETPEAWINKGIAVSRQGDQREAVALLTHGIELGPLRPARAYFARAVAWETLGRPREAYEDYGQAARLDPDWPQPAEELRRFQVVRRKVLQG